MCRDKKGTSALSLSSSRGSTGVEPGDTEEFISAMKGIMRMPLGSVLQMLCSINYILNDEKLELKDITIFDGEQSEMTSQLESARSENDFHSR